MNELQLDPILVQWLRDGPAVGPEHGLQRALAASRKVNQRPGWTFGSSWLPTQVVGLDLRVSRGLAVGLLLVVTVALLAMFAAVAGTIPRQTRPITQGNLIAYQDGSAIAVAQPDGADRRTLTAGVGFARLPVFSPDGHRVAFVAPSSADARGGRLLVVPVDGRRDPVDLSDGIEVVASDVPQISWSPDGSRIAFAAQKESVTTIFVAASDGTGAPVAITNSSADRDLPTWSPDGSWIGFRERDPDGIRTRLRRVTPDGADVQEITAVIAADAYLSKPRWFQGTEPTSYWYSPGFGTETTAYIDLGFTHKNQPWAGSPGGLADFGIPWSPNGTQLAFLSRDEGVVVADYDGTDPYDGHVRILGHVADCWIDWAPGGDALFGGSPDGCNGVVVIPVGNPGAAFTVPGSMAGIASWQPRVR